MGVLACQQREQFVITSDRTADDQASKRAAKMLSPTYLVWTGDHWSADMTVATTFARMDDAEEYVRVHYTQVMA